MSFWDELRSKIANLEGPVNTPPSPSTWGNSIDRTFNTIDFDKISKELGYFSDHLDNENNCLNFLEEFPSLSFITISTGVENEFSLFHHVKGFPLLQDNPENKTYFALSGLDKCTGVLELIPSRLLKTEKFRAPTLDVFADKQVNNISNLTSSNEEEVSTSNYILPPLLAKIISDLKSTSTQVAFDACLDAILDLNFKAKEEWTKSNPETEDSESDLGTKYG